MVCCEKDVTFLGIMAKGAELDRYENRDWVEVTARMEVEEHDAYQGNRAHKRAECHGVQCPMECREKP